jgi:hemerythrin-like domain-containing protein
MSDAIVVLKLEHHQIARVLDLIDVQHLNVAAGAPANYFLLESIFDYLSLFPAESHHPKEDLIYRKLLERIPEIATSLRDLVEEHWKLALLTKNLRHAIRQSPPDPPAANEALGEQLREFVNTYRLHMQMEEEHFFPLALRRLSSNDLAEIDFTLFSQSHRFSWETEDRFTDLHDAITSLGKADQTSTHHRDEAIWLAGFRDIAAFNEEMRATGARVCLRRSEEGYELECEGNAQAHIPECSEARAAWCAYFFWKATIQARVNQ